MKLKFIYALTLLVVSLSVNAQQKPFNLKIGDEVPSIFIPKVINDEKTSFNTLEFKDKLLILDFWSTTCSGCIAGLPKMVSLQKQFGDKIKILPVTTQPEILIRTFMKDNKIVKSLKVPSVVADKALSQWFKHLGEPHEAWIYKGKVIAISNSEYVDAYNIQKVLDGKILKLPVKDDFYQYDYRKPFLSFDTIDVNHQSTLNYTAVAGYQEGANIRSLSIMSYKNGLSRIYFTNYTVLGAYKMLWDKLKKIDYIESAGVGDAGGISPNQVILEVRDKSRYIYSFSTDYQESWYRQYGISYEWVSTDTVADFKVRNQMIIHDLDRLLGLKGRWKKRQTRCLVLVRTDTADRIKSSSRLNVFEYKGEIKKLRNSGLSSLVYYLNSFPENPPVFDGTDYKNPVDIDLNFNLWTDIPAIRKALQTYGLDLKEETRELDMFVLTETNLNKQDK